MCCFAFVSCVPLHKPQSTLKPSRTNMAWLRRQGCEADASELTRRSWSCNLAPDASASRPRWSYGGGHGYLVPIQYPSSGGQSSAQRGRSGLLLLGFGRDGCLDATCGLVLTALRGLHRRNYRVSSLCAGATLHCKR